MNIWKPKQNLHFSPIYKDANVEIINEKWVKSSFTNSYKFAVMEPSI